MVRRSRRGRTLRAYSGKTFDIQCSTGMVQCSSQAVLLTSVLPLSSSRYKAFARRLAERGFVTFVPHSPYRGGDSFRQLQRQANPIGLSLFSIILEQHATILEWLSSLRFVDATRIGFYGLSYGGKSAMRIPALLTQYISEQLYTASFTEKYVT